MSTPNTFDAHLFGSLKKRISEGDSTKSDRLIFARQHYNNLARSNYKTRFNLISRLRDKSLMSDKRLNRIVAGKGSSHKDTLVTNHAEALADKIKARAEEHKNQTHNK